MRHELRYAAAWWLAFLLLYLLLAGNFDWQEGVAGLGLAGVATVAMTATRRAASLYFQPRLGWLRHFRRLPRQVLVDCAIVATALARALFRRAKVEGVFRTIPFDPGGDDAESAARRALVTAGVCLAPNTYVVAIDAERGEMLLHQLVPSAQPPGGGDREWPL